MIQLNSIVQCADNSGAKDILCIQVLKNQHEFGNSVCLFKGVVKSTSNLKMKKSSIVLCLLIGSKKKTKNVRFSENRCIVLKPDFQPLATRIFGPTSILKKHSAYSKFLKGLSKDTYL